ncbi:MAG: esterase-like activity of phytase family protein [Pseudomonadota bacterium]
MRGAVALLLATLLPALPSAEERAVAVTAVAVEVTPDALSGVRQREAWQLTADSEDFGGFSALLLRGGRFFALTDRSVWMVGRYRPDDVAGPLVEVRMSPLPAEIAPQGADDRDAEALAAACETLAIAFERDHRIAWQGAGGATTLRPAPLADLPFNGGIEGLATMPQDCDLILAIGEDQLEGLGVDGGHPVFLFRAGEAEPVARTTLPPIGPHGVTAAEFGPYGRLYVLFRHWSRQTGTNIRLRRYTVPPDETLEFDAGETLAEWGRDSGIDNMEAIALWQDAAGRTRIAILSDDNFNTPRQRTLLIDLVVE